MSVLTKSIAARLSAFARAGVFSAFTLGLAACEEIVDFSGQPREELASISAQTQQTPVYVAERIAIGSLETALAGSLPGVLSEVSERVRKAVCSVEDGDKICRDAVVTGTVERDGEPRLNGTPAGFEVEVPVRIALKARESRKGAAEPIQIARRATVKATIKGGLSESWVASMQLDGPITWSEPPEVKVFDGRLSIAADVERVIKRRLKQFADGLADMIQPKQLKAMTQSTWRALQSPVQIAERPDIWLIGDPVDVRFGGFAVRPDRQSIEIRSAVITRLRTVVGTRPTPLWPRAMVQLSVAPTNAGGGVILPVEVSYEQLREGLDRSVMSGTFPSKPSVNGAPVEPVSYTIKSIRLQPAGVKLALGVDLALAIPGSMRNLRGYAYYLCTPEVRQGDTLLRLTKAALFDPASIPEGRRGTLQPILEKAFAERVELATAYDLGPAMQQAMALVNTASDRRLAEGLHLKGKLNGWKVRSAEPGKTALRLNVEFTGELIVSDDRASVAAGTPIAADPGLPPQ